MITDAFRKLLRATALAKIDKPAPANVLVAASEVLDLLDAYTDRDRLAAENEALRSALAAERERVSGLPDALALVCAKVCDTRAWEASGIGRVWIGEDRVPAWLVTRACADAIRDALTATENRAPAENRESAEFPQGSDVGASEEGRRCECCGRRPATRAEWREFLDGPKREFPGVCLNEGSMECLAHGKEAGRGE